MKRDMQEITDKENEIKNSLDEAGKQKLKYKEHCDKMKQNIKGNREKYKKQESGCNFLKIDCRRSEFCSIGCPWPEASENGARPAEM